MYKLFYAFCLQYTELLYYAYLILYFSEPNKSKRTRKCYFIYGLNLDI